MKKFIKFLLMTDIIFVLFLFGVLLADKETLSERILRLHVVANSDSVEDQQIKLQVRDAVLNMLEPAFVTITDKEQAEAYLNEHLSEIREVANTALIRAGSENRAEVTLCREEFPIREYDTFSLPSGVYDSLRITIGEGDGKNWWCAIFPSFCLDASSEDTADKAVSAGFSEGLTSAITGQKGYQISFFFLDCLGKLENLFHFQ